MKQTMWKAFFGLVMLMSASQAVALSPTLPSDGSDIRPAIDLAIDALCAPTSTDRTLHLPAGAFNLLTKPKAIPCALTIVGQGKGATRIARRYPGAWSYMFMWTRGLDESGGAIRDLSLEAGPGTVGGIAIYVVAVADPNASSNSLNRHSFLIDNVHIGRVDGSASWAQGIYLDGYQNPDNSNGIAPGIRGAYVSRTSVSGTTSASVYLYKARGVWLEMDCYIPLAPSSSAFVALDGKTQSVRLDTRSCSFAFVDSQSTGAILNNVPIGPQ